jgi:two-component sensor histidine kinase
MSVPDGRVDILWSVTRNRLRLIWREHGGPRIDKKPAFSGFGTLLITSSAAKVAQRFTPDGLVCKLEFAL